eukprot:SAG11_NODE_7292_length_1165_cov_1.985929_1_plen_25_part_10
MRQKLDEGIERTLRCAWIFSTSEAL